MALRTIDAATLKSLLDNNEDLALVDVREPEEYVAGNICGATLIPLDEICMSALPLHVGKKLVIYCRSGRRSQTACERLLTEDPDLETYNLEGGVEAWNAL